MPNTNAPFGFRVLERQEGGAPTYGQTTWRISSGDGHHFFTGDLVELTSNPGGEITLFEGSSAATNKSIVGVFNGCSYYSAVTNSVIKSAQLPPTVATGPVTAYVISDPSLWFYAQVSSANFGSSDPTIGTSIIGQTVSVLQPSSASGNTISGQSGNSIASTIAYIGSSLASSMPWQVVDIYSNYAPPGLNGTDNSSAQFFQCLVVKPRNWVLSPNFQSPSS